MSAPSSTAAATERHATAVLGVSFKQMMAAVRRLRGRETHSRDRISNAQFQLLSGLREHQRLSSGELAHLAGLSAASTTQMLDALEADGLVVRERCAEDRRKVLTSLTDHGHELVAERQARFAPMWRDALAEFSDEELGTASAVMDRVTGLFDRLAAGDGER